MVHKINLKSYFIVFVTFLCLGLSKHMIAQTNFSVNQFIDSTCTLYLSLVDSNNNIVSNNPPYFFNVGSNNYNNNSLALANFNLSSESNGIYTINITDGNQNTFSSSVVISCGQAPPNPSSTILGDSVFQDASNCLICDGIAEVNVYNSIGGYHFFSWSNGFQDTSFLTSSQNNLCPGNHYVVATDSLGNNYVSSFSIGCNTPPADIPSCFQYLDVILDVYGHATIYPQDLNTNQIFVGSTKAYIIDNNDNIFSSYTFDCNELGYHNFSLLFVDSLTKISDTCNILVEVKDTLGICNGLQSNHFEVQGSPINASSCNICDGIYVIQNIIDTSTLVNAPYPYSYLWSNGQNSGPTVSNLCPNQLYTVTIVDANGKDYIHDFTIGCNIATSGNCYDPNQIDTNLNCPTFYYPVCGCDGITYKNSCVAEYQHGITAWYNGICNTHSGFTYSASSSPSSFCDTLSGCNGSITIVINGGSQPSITWSDSTISGLTPTGLCPGNYTFTITDLTGDTISSIITVGITGCVWPGDTDNNTIANNFDLLPIALAYSDAGIMRTDTGINWSAHAAQNWNMIPINGLYNHKYVDCNGSGVIDSSDIYAILQNYGQSYYRSSISSLFGPAPFLVQSTTATPGDTVSIAIHLGDQINQITNAYGVAFSINYDPSLIESGSLSASFNNSWLGTDLLEIQKDFSAYGTLDLAISRKNKVSISGHGEIGRISFTIKDDVWIGKINNPNNNLIAPFTISNIRLIDNQNNEIGTNPQSGIITIVSNTAINNINNDIDIKVFPNPTNGNLHIISQKAIIHSVRIFTTTGQLIDNIDNLNPQNNTIRTDKLPSNIYFISILTNEGVYNQRIHVIK
ncbi:MAG: T9SS type A sorting domain-containing protein [Saprospiraceae bacterium]|nr:T9SS type A sorting domain-containing protein [Saprospiraceae bacterium]